MAIVTTSKRLNVFDDTYPGDWRCECLACKELLATATYKVGDKVLINAMEARGVVCDVYVNSGSHWYEMDQLPQSRICYDVELRNGLVDEACRESEISPWQS